MTDTETNPFVRAALLGTISGIRSVSAPALASMDAVQNERDLDGTPFAWLSSENASTLLALSAAGEMLLDKLPFLPNRTNPVPLLGRVLLGGYAGAVVFAEEKEPALAGAAVAGLASVVSTQVSFRIRRTLSRKLPGPLSGLAGDVAVVLLGRAFLRM